MDESSAAAAFAELLRRMKRQGDCSFEELARKSYVSRSTLHRYCAGISLPPEVAIVTRIATVCGASREELHQAIQAWLLADAERRQSRAGIVPRRPREDVVPSAESPAVPGRPGVGTPAVRGRAAAAGTPAVRGRTAAGTPAARARTAGAAPGVPGRAAAGPPAAPGRTTAAPAAPGRGVAATRRRPIVVLAVLVALMAATASAGIAPPAEDTARPQWISGPSWVRSPVPVAPTMFGVTVASDLGDMPSFKVGAVRFWDSGTRWASIQPRRGVFDWTTLDRLVSGANRAGLPALFVLGGTPGWAAPAAPKAPYGDGSRAAAPDDLRDWDTFVRALAHRYRGRIEAYELWVLANDPRFFTGPTRTLVEMARRAGTIIKRADPAATVVCPGMGRLWTPDGRRVLQRFAELGGYQYCDAAGIKLYQKNAADPPETMLTVLAQVGAVLHRAGVDPPLWNTGTTYDIPLEKRLDEEHAVDYAVRFYLTGLYGMEENLRRMYFYSWGNTRIPLVLQAAEGAPTPAARAVQELQRWLAHARIRSCGQGPPSGLPAGVWQCDFVVPGAGGSRPAHIRWTSTGAAGTVAPPGARVIRRLDGSSVAVRPGDAVRVGERPLLIE